jgi:predicted unusual protein kinase regulating ubiquinone biosynthesis (AarF/ABC1/UbiB family)
MEMANEDSDDRLERLRAELLGDEHVVPTSGLGRLWRSGRSALSVGAQLVRGRRGQALDDATIAKVVRDLGQLRGIAMKLGQMLSYVDHSVPAELRSMMALLQTSAPITPLAVVAQTLRAEHGEARAEALLATLSPSPIAVASIGQVHRARLPDGSGTGGREVAVKVSHPNIARAIAADFRAAAIGRVVAAVAGAGSVPEMIDEARTAFLEECDLGLEAARQRRFARLFAGDPTIVVPPVEEAWSTERVLVTRWTPGATLDAFLARGPSQRERDVAGEALFRFWMRTLYRDGLFHGDPHPGNFAFREDGRIAVYDFGCVRELDAPLRLGFARLAAATRADDVDAMAAALESLGGAAPRSSDGRAHMRRLLRGFFAPLLVDARRRIGLDEGAEGRDVLRDKRAVLAMRLPPRMLFLFRLRFGLYAVLARLGAEANWAGLERAWADEAALT